jgi:hypothetical protein
VLANDKPVPNRLELLVVDVPNNEDEAKAGAVFGNKDGELLLEMQKHLFVQTLWY